MPLCLTGNRSMSAEGRTLFHPVRPPKDRGSWGSELAGRDNRTTQRTEETGRRCGRRVEVKSKRVSCSVMSNSSRPHGLWSARVFCPCNFPGKNTGVGIHSLLQGIFPTQGLNPHLLHRRQILYCLSHQGSPRRSRLGRGQRGSVSRCVC